ncbi:hypothetical protein [Kineococcus sp. SYSU DK002]|uniref:hypothetical protein n=1 Tax=Kineococcus sp. SYSU DK002 TaxID=3383123 RepID=UPI003D7DF093
MSTDPGARHHDLLTVLRGGPAGTPAPAPQAPAAVTLLPAAATSRHQLAVDTALAGDPLVVDTGSGTGSEGAVLLTGLLAALAAAGRRVTLVPGAATAAARLELTGLGLGHLLADTPEDPSRRGADLPPADPNRWLSVLRDLDARHRAWFGGPGGDGAPSRSDALAGLAALRAEHLHPPLLPAAAAWTAQDRARVVDLLGRGGAAGDDALHGADDEQVAAAGDALDALPATLDRLAGLLARLGAEVRWRSPRTLADVEVAPALLARVEQALRTYVPSALHTDLDHAAAILARQPRSLLSAEERERRRELKRLSSLRHDGAGFGTGDVQALTELHRAWAERADGTPATFSGRDELVAVLDAVRRDLPVVAALLPGVPADPEVAALPGLADRVRGAAAAARARRDRAAVSADGLEDLVAAVPAGASPAEVARLVEGTTWRALVEAPDPGGVPVDRLAEEFRRLDEQRRARAARELQLALSGARAVAVTVAAEPDAGDLDVLVVDDAHRLDAGRVADLAGRARQVVLLGTGADQGSAWDRARAALGAVSLDLPRRASAVRDAVAAAVTAAGPSAEAGTGADLVLRADGAVLLLDLEDSLALLRVQDREVALPARHRAAGEAYRLLRVADWFTDPRGTARRLVEELRAVQPATPAAAPVPVPAPVPAESFPKGLGSAQDAHRAVSEFVAALAGGNPNIDQTPAATVDAAVALAYADLGVQAADAAVLDAAMELLTYRRRGTKVLRAFKESVQRSKKKMRGAGVKVP